MAGTLFGLGLQQNVDINGRPLSGCLLYIYAAGTSTPSVIYQDFGLSVITSWPLEADSTGRIPQFWLADGSYRARLTDSMGIEIYDFDGIAAIGASSGGGGGGGGGGSTVDANSVLQIGDFLWSPLTGVRSGFVRANARTMGSASSGATERANADTQSLYSFLWTNFSNTLCPVTTGRGGSALADFNANKSIATLDMRGYGIFGLDDMGNSAVGRLVTGTPTVAASATGAEKTTIALANLPSTNLDTSTLTASVGTGITSGTNVNRNITNGSFGNFGATGGGHNVFDSFSGSTSTLSLASGTVTFGGTLPLGGSGTAATTISPGRLGSWYIKL